MGAVTDETVVVFVVRVPDAVFPLVVEAEAAAVLRRTPVVEEEVTGAEADAAEALVSGDGDGSLDSTPGEQTKWTVVGQSGSKERRTSFNTKWSCNRRPEKMIFC